MVVAGCARESKAHFKVHSYVSRWAIKAHLQSERISWLRGRGEGSVLAAVTAPPPQQGIAGEWRDKSGLIVYRMNGQGRRPTTGWDNWKNRWSCCQERKEQAPLCVERTDVDGAARDMRVVSRNANLRGLVHVEERCSYAPHPERPDEWTLFRQETSIRCAPLAAVAAKVAELVERRCAERFAQNAANGRDVVERICEDLAQHDSDSHGQI